MLIVQCEEYLEAVKQYAREHGALEQLEAKLAYLGSYGKNTECYLFQDFAPNSFEFVVMRPDNEQPGTWARWFNGGLIYWDKSNSWSVHT